MTDVLFPGVAHLQNLHPLVVHFPVGLLPAAALCYGVAWATGRDAPAWTALALLVLGTVGGAAAAATGLRASQGVMVSESVREHLLVPHLRLMVATTVTAAACTAWALVDRPFPRRPRAVFVLAVLVLVLLLARGADYGGRMVYDYNAGGDACGQPIDFTR